MLRDLFRRNPLAVVLAVAMHLLILLFLAVGVDWWRTPRPVASRVEVMQARLIEREPAPVETGPSKAELEEQRRLEQARHRAEAQRQKKLAAKKAAEEAARRKAEEQQKRQAEARKRQEVERQAKLAAEKKRREQERLAVQRRKAEKAKKAAERKKAELERQRKLEAEKKRKAEQERRRKAEARARAEKAKAAAEAKSRAEAKAKAEAEAKARAAREAELASHLQAEEDARERDRAILAIQQKVERNWLRPPGTAGRGLRCKVRVRLSSQGLVILASVVESSGNAAFDRSVIGAVEKAEPLPMPGSAHLVAEFRDIVFEFAPEK